MATSNSVRTDLEIGEAPEYQPTPAQTARAAALHRFNWLAVYAPLLAMGLVVLVLLLLMLIRTLPDEGSAQARELVSGLADIFIIVSITPFIILAAIIPVATVVLFVQARQRDMSPLRRLQRLFWRLESFLGRLHERVLANAPRVAAPVIRLNALLAYVVAAGRHIYRIVTRR